MKLPALAKELYPENQWEMQEKRYTDAAKRFEELFGAPHAMIFSAPGRSEICGNHTDHNMGKAVGASVTLDILAFVAPRADGIIRILADGFPRGGRHRRHRPEGARKGRLRRPGAGNCQQNEGEGL